MMIVMSLRAYVASLIKLLVSEPVGQQSVAPNGNLVKKGWLLRLTRKQWSQHWFVLKNGSLTYYRGPAAELCSFLDGVLDLSLIKHIQQEEEEANKNNNYDQNIYAFSLKMWNGEHHVLAASSLLDRSQWLEAILESTSVEQDDDGISINSSSSNSSSAKSSPTSNGPLVVASHHTKHSQQQQHHHHHHHHQQQQQQQQHLDAGSHLDNLTVTLRKTRLHNSVNDSSIVGFDASLTTLTATSAPANNEHHSTLDQHHHHHDVGPHYASRKSPVDVGSTESATNNNNSVRVLCTMKNGSDASQTNTPNNNIITVDRASNRSLSMSSSSSSSINTSDDNISNSSATSSNVSDSSQESHSVSPAISCKFPNGLDGVSTNQLSSPETLAEYRPQQILSSVPSQCCQSSVADGDHIDGIDLQEDHDDHHHGDEEQQSSDKTIDQQQVITGDDHEDRIRLPAAGATVKETSLHLCSSSEGPSVIRTDDGADGDRGDDGGDGDDARWPASTTKLDQSAPSPTFDLTFTTTPALKCIKSAIVNVSNSGSSSDLHQTHQSAPPSVMKHKKRVTFDLSSSSSSSSSSTSSDSDNDDDNDNDNDDDDNNNNDSDNSTNNTNSNNNDHTYGDDLSCSASSSDGDLHEVDEDQETKHTKQQAKEEREKVEFTNMTHFNDHHDYKKQVDVECSGYDKNKTLISIADENHQVSSLFGQKRKEPTTTYGHEYHHDAQLRAAINMDLSEQTKQILASLELAGPYSCLGDLKVANEPLQHAKADGEDDLADEHANNGKVKHCYNVNSSESKEDPTNPLATDKHILCSSACNEAIQNDEDDMRNGSTGGNDDDDDEDDGDDGDDDDGDDINHDNDNRNDDDEEQAVMDHHGKLMLVDEKEAKLMVESLEEQRHLEFYQLKDRLNKQQAVIDMLKEQLRGRRQPPQVLVVGPTEEGSIETKVMEISTRRTQLDASIKSEPNFLQQVNDSIELRERLSLAESNMKSLTKQLRDSYSNYDCLEISYNMLKQSVKCSDDQHRNEMTQMKLKVDDLTNKLLISGRQLMRTRNRLTRCELKNKSYRRHHSNCVRLLNFSKDLQKKLVDLERKVNDIHQLIMVTGGNKETSEVAQVLVATDRADQAQQLVQLQQHVIDNECHECDECVFV